MRVYDDALGAHGLLVGQVLLAPLDFGHRQQYLHARQTLTRLLELGVVPVVNENDATADDEIRFGDNDRLAALVAHLVSADLLGAADRHRRPVHRRSPACGPRPRSSKRSSRSTTGLERVAGGPGSAVGSGGMASKLAAAKIAAWSGVRVGHRRRARGPGCWPPWSRASRGRHGVPATPRGACRPASSGSPSPWRPRAPWSSTPAPAGRWSSARRRSCPPAWCRSTGRFDAEDAVEIAGPDGEVFAKGLVGYPAERIADVGRATDQ